MYRSDSKSVLYRPHQGPRHTAAPDPIFLTFSKFPRETVHCNILVVPNGKAMCKIRSATGMTLAYLTSLNPLTDLGRTIKSQKNYCSDSNFKK